MRSAVSALSILAIAGGLSACSNSAARYQPIVDGPRDARYAGDLKECQQVATERSYVNGDVRSNALVGAGVGTLLGAESLGGALVGGLLGTAIVGGWTAWDARGERKDIVVNCMRNRDHPVVD
ncbi:MAG: glycine zipper family protein [Geminicoccaceae bacterium]